MKKIILIKFLVFFTQLIFASDWTQRGGVVESGNGSKNIKSWQKIAKTPKKSVSELLKMISANTYGKALIDKASEKALLNKKKLEDVIEVGDVSLTDTTLIRRFSATNPFEVSYQAESKIFIDKSHDVKNALLDLVHELTHFAYKEPFNPYKENFSLAGFIVETIEGRGGEVDAFLVECKIGKSIFGDSALSSQCKSIVDFEGNFSKEKAINEFYKLGAFFDKFQTLSSKYNLNLINSKPLSRDAGLLISSAWSSPYPVAVIEEYKTIMVKVCENDMRRVSYFEDNQGRMPASELISFKSMKKNVTARCVDTE